MIIVKATREGLLGHKTSVGEIVDEIVPFVALPSTAALRLWVRLTNVSNGKQCRALVLDVGPWNEHDNAYVFGGKRPLAESGKDTRGRKTNGAGIDLSEKVWKLLDMHDNTDVGWEFI